MKSWKYRCIGADSVQNSLPDKRLSSRGSSCVYWFYSLIQRGAITRDFSPTSQQFPGRHVLTIYGRVLRLFLYLD